MLTIIVEFLIPNVLDRFNEREVPPNPRRRLFTLSEQVVRSRHIDFHDISVIEAAELWLSFVQYTPESIKCSPVPTIMIDVVRDLCIRRPDSAIILLCDFL